MFANDSGICVRAGNSAGIFSYELQPILRQTLEAAALIS